MVSGATVPFDVSSAESNDLLDVGEFDAHEPRGAVHVKNEGSYYVIGVRFEGMKFFDKAKLNRFLSPYSKELKNKIFMYSLLAGLGVAIIYNFLFSPSMAATIAVLFGTALTLFMFMPF